MSRSYDGVSDVEISLLEHRMFARSDDVVVGAKDAHLGVLYTVNFMPGNMEIPISVRWTAPDDTVIDTPARYVTYMEHEVASLPLAKAHRRYGTWLVEFFFDGNKIAEKSFQVMSPEQFQANNATPSPEG